jgi:hypothetical protein
MSKTINALRRHALAGLALFVALSGTAVAASEIGSDDIARNAVKSAHIKSNQVKGGDVKEASLKGLVKGNAKTVAKSASAPQGGFLPTPIPLVKVPGMGQVELIYCGNTGQGNQIRVRLLSNDDAEPFLGSNVVTSSALPVGTGKTDHVDHGGGTFGSGGGEPMIAQVGPNSGIDFGVAAKWDFTFWRGTGKPRAAHVTVSGLNGLVSGDRCEVSAQGEIYG